MNDTHTNDAQAMQTSPSQAAPAPARALAEYGPDRIKNGEGVVKWFDPKKGFGFIIGPEGQDIFAHYTRIAGEGFRILKDGSKVVYDAERGDKGWNASRVVAQDAGDGQARRGHARTPRR
jgi:CspA family cold shock protein